LSRFRKIAPALVLAVVALAAATGTVSAHGGGGGWHRGGGGTPGTLSAAGDGIAAAGGSMTIHVCAEDGILLTKGNVSIPDDAFTDTVGGWWGLNVYFGFNGCADVGGTMTATNNGGGGLAKKAAALVAGTGLTLDVEGNGIAFLKGTGTWTDGNGGSGDWTEEGDVLKVAGECAMQAQHGGGKDKPDACATPEPTATPTETP
jgi:hypothetical protein